MMREYQVRICEGLGVKFPGPTRPELSNRDVGFGSGIEGKPNEDAFT
jgi:hypothetical protein